MKNNKLDIFEQNAEFFERFNNSPEDTAEDRHERTRFTVTGLENKVEFAVSNAQGRIKKAEDDAVDRLNNVNGMTNDELISKSVGSGKWMREGGHGFGATRLGFAGEVPVVTSVVAGNTLTVGGVKTDGYSVLSLGYANNSFSSRLALSVTSDRLWFNRGTVSAIQEKPWTEILHNSNTRTDKNNVLHSGTGTPINTLNVSDMAQDVVDRDDVTVTSGAVYRALDELRAEIALLKGEAE